MMMNNMNGEYCFKGRIVLILCYPYSYNDLIRYLSYNLSSMIVSLGNI
jgi:hypothetical protein